MITQESGTDLDTFGLLRKERRIEVRFATTHPAKMRVLKPFRSSFEDVLIIDASRNGVRIHAERSLGVGSIVQASFDTTHFVAEVRNCIPAADGFDIGLYISVFYDRQDPTTHTTGMRLRRIITDIDSASS
jgi:hypothetical protein